MRDSWLDPLRRTLDNIEQPVPVFFRDDDVGWGDARLLTLLDLFAEHGLPVDLAVIPLPLTPQLVATLRMRVENPAVRVGLHQHGFAHINHQAVGRKCEFGTERSAAMQYRDIALGQQQLKAAFGEHVDAIFTPPWNRCTEETAHCLRALGFQALSRESHATPFNLPELDELSVSIDWFASCKHVRLSRRDFGAHCAEAFFSARPIGIMLHHARMDRDEFRALEELLSILSRHSSVRCCSMAAVRNA
jgi:hypothetical protein